MDNKRIHLILKISLWLKSIFALLEIAGGAVFFFLSHSQLVNIIAKITQDELTEDPTDFIASHLNAATQGLFASTQHFIAFYLLSHGVIKLAVIIGLLKKKNWSYPLSLAVFSAFVLYQLQRFYFSHSAWLLIITFFDILVIWLVWKEYGVVKNARSNTETNH